VHALGPYSGHMNAAPQADVFCKTCEASATHTKVNTRRYQYSLTETLPDTSTASIVSE
jgi:hypothetical protein